MYKDLATLTDKELRELRTRTEKEIVKLNNQQMTIKILMNSLYGALS